MDAPLEQPIESSVSPDLLRAYKRLSTLMYAVALSILILSGTFFIFLLRQVSLLRAQTDRAMIYVQEFRQSGLPEAMRTMEKDLVEFAQKNPDFRPILTKYMPPRPTTPTTPASTNR